MATVKLGLTGLPATGLVARAQAIHDALTGNAKYPTPNPKLVDLQAGIDALIAANAAVDKNAGPAEHQARRVAEKALRALLKSLAGYVQSTSGGDANTILGSGFSVVKRGSAKGLLNPPANLMQRITTMSGRVSLKWDAEAGTDSYVVYASDKNDPFAWTPVGYTTKSRFDVDGQVPGSFRWFAVSAVGAAGESSKSDPVKVLVAA